MVEIQLEKEVIQLFKHIEKNKNFLLTGGAGSGKTYSLVQVIKKVIHDNPNSMIACITYTNTAVKEIGGRVNHSNLRVSTIHEFLWENIKKFQKELKMGLVSLINNENSKIKIQGSNEIIDQTYFNKLEDGIQYKEFTLVNSGIISHDEVLELANYMFKSHPLLCNLLKDKYQFILIDEYQDTNPLIVEIFLEHLKQGKKKTIIGFFGDSMQSIYDDGIGSLEKYIASGDIVEFQKQENRRNPRLVIELANRLRIDSLVQVPSSDQKAPNMYDGSVKEGSIKFLYSSNDNLDMIKTTSFFETWDFKDTTQTKELNLTHNLIAAKAGFSELMEIYDKEPIISFKNDVLNKVKQDSEEIREKILNNNNITFEEVVDLYPIKNRQRQLKKDLIMQDSHTNQLYNQLKNLPFSHVRKIYINKDSLIDDKKQDNNDDNKNGTKRDALIKHLFKIQSLIQYKCQ
ncbi:UvrD-helicase domain-containing protein [Bacillus sp. J37]|uniref:UvrD-helicase domain-containing protein n=1 Tax=Bacillus sp. J37 TaxID=935837 RepID=UPI0004B06A7E|nr:UvrD-helicase domain-containing protein [Bacillus sp. J37]